MRNPIILLALFCAACATTSASLPTIRPYHMDIQQGNVVTPKMMMQLKPGMTKAQVRFVMGTPLIADSFHADRWDYFYSLLKNGQLIEQRRVILEFEKDALKRVRGDVIPAGSAGAAAEKDKTLIAPTSIWENKPYAPKEEDKGVLDKLKFWGDDKKAGAKPESEPAVKPEPKPEPKAEPVKKPEPAPVVKEEKPVEKLPEKLQEEPSAAPQEEKKGLLDKLKFWDKDKKAEPKPEVQPAPEPVVKPEPKPEPKVEPVSKPAPAVVEEKPQEEKKGLLDKLKFWDDGKETPKPEPKAAPARVEETVPQSPPVKRAPVAEPVTAKPVPKPAELPPEEDSSYFDRMLEKIGF